MTAKTFKARPTVYKGIQMRSRLEAGFATWLDKHHFEWEYEPYALATDDGQYLPDFVLGNVFAAWLPKPVTVVVEVKPNSYSVEGRRDLFPEAYDLEPVKCDRSCPPHVSTPRAAQLLKEAGIAQRNRSIIHSEDCAVKIDDRRIMDEHQRIRQQALLVWKSDPEALMVVARPRGFCLMVRDGKRPQERIAALARLREKAAHEAVYAAILADHEEHYSDAELANSIWNDWHDHPVGLIRLPEGRLGLAGGQVEAPWQGEYWKPGRQGVSP